ncbi:MAG: hypothetical protein PHY87_03560 [Sphaerochaeta sp.]|jgi:hypothetical protein|uniref:hypothetical protein n=1 Tax=Sphaerochaeta sp. TaxID=1972642 RepID=UPI001D7DA503|nr:hypothetical protein [uncultured Sphaerochaeta sp.]MDD3058666.1 hypothetical protein [Sphaerochaeta sp.]MDD3928851.1 hypothetical protein [Sphaerochaeta sp.]NCC13332.1 hypothetical protein [Spirochaetia bacterium]NCC90706.1 hypothetical protein [Spirochaetia bacterium]
MKRTRLVVLVVLTLLLCSSCLATAVPEGAKPAGFFLGIWHGWIAPIALIARLFNPIYRIYETNNTGWWYEFGFYIALVGGFGSIALFRRKHGDDHR